MSKPIIMDTRKFLSALNSSAQSKVALFEGLVKKIGAKSGASWRLAALHPDSLFIEDDNHQYYVAKHQRLKGGNISITDIKPIQLVEEQKQGLFESNCRSLVDAIEKNDQKGMRTSYSSLAAQRFSARAVPQSGMVRTRDGAVRNLRVGSELLTVEQKTKLIAAIVESVTDTVTIDGGTVISANFGENTHKRLPVSEWTRCKVAGTIMRETAQNAWRSAGFQARAYQVAKLIDEDKLTDAVKSVKDFLVENQEFCMLMRGELQALIDKMDKK